MIDRLAGVSRTAYLAGMANASKVRPDGVERVREEDRAQIVALFDALQDAQAVVNRAQIALATAQQDHAELNRRLMKKYVLGERDGIDSLGVIHRNMPAPTPGPR
jgi:hypothetical protein